MDQIFGTWIPTWVLVLVVSVLTISLFIGIPLARSAGLRRGRRAADPEQLTTRRERAKDTALFLAALIPSVLVWLAVMGVSFIGLTGFARDVMAWDHWTNMLVPLSLDGISVSFGAWAFVAVKRGRHPGRAYKIVFAAATVSATLNFVHGRETYSIWAGVYLAFLSFAGMAMFHELLDQFMAGYDDELALKTKNPRFGLRWFLAPLSTFLAWRTWIVHPPLPGTRPTVRDALDHRAVWLREHRAAKLSQRTSSVVEEQQALIVERLARAEANRALIRPDTFASTHTASNGHPVAVDHPANGAPLNAVPVTPLTHANGVRHDPAPVVAAGAPAQVQRRDAMVDSGELNMNQRTLSAAMDRPAREMIETALRNEDRLTSTVVCDWVAQHVAATLNQEWRPSEGWAKQRIRDVKQQLGLPAQEELVDAAH